MLKSVVRAAPRRIFPSRSNLNQSFSRRLLSTAPPSQKSRSWKSSAARWALAAGAIYYYNTSNVFAEEPEAAIQRLDESVRHIQESNLPTVDTIVEEKRQRQAQRAAEEKGTGTQTVQVEAEQVDDTNEDGLGSLEDEADQQGAFNPETGEINWDCPCLGGMAHGPCGEEFRAAFSCFVYSQEEPKGVECIEKFKGMQDCFRLHPEMYGSELEDDEDELEEELHAREGAQQSRDAQSTPAPEASAQPAHEVSSETSEKGKPVEGQSHTDSPDTTPKSVDASGDEGGDLLPKDAHDASSD